MDIEDIDSVKLALIATESLSALKPLAATGWTALGAATVGVFVALIFLLQKWLLSGDKASASEEGEDESLLPESGSCGPEGWHSPASKAEVSSIATETTPWGVLICSALMAVPSVLGAWCWPLLLVALFPAATANGSIDSDSNREISHHFTWGADIVLFTTVIVYVGRMACLSPWMQDSFSRWGPLTVVSLSSVLLILDPTRHVLLDHGGVFFKERTLSMYTRRGELSAIGRFCQISSIVGLCFLFLGLLWHLRVPEKLLRHFYFDNQKSL